MCDGPNVRKLEASAPDVCVKIIFIIVLINILYRYFEALNSRILLIVVYTFSGIS